MNTEPNRILLVEDNEVDRMAVERLFEKESLPYTLVFAGTVREARARIREGGLDLVLIDHLLPDGTGLDVQRELGTIPCIFITAVDDMQIPVQAMKAGAADFLVKDGARAFTELLPLAIESAFRQREETKARQQAEEKLRKTLDELDARVQERTAELERANENLKKEVAEREEAEEALRRSEEHYRSLVETMNDGLGVQDAHGSITYVNTRLCEMLGFSKDELVGLPALELIDPSEREAFRSSMAQRGNGESMPYETLFVGKDGQKIPTLVSPRPMFDAEGGFKGSFAVMTDISEQKRTEQALRASEERFRILTESAPIGIYCHDLSGTFTYANKKAEEIIGQRREDVIGENFLNMSLFGPEDLVRAGKLLMLNAQGQATGPEQFTLHRQDGTERVVEISDATITLEGRPTVLGMVQDITGRTRAEEELRHTTSTLNSIFTSPTGYAIVATDLDFRIIHYSPAAERLFGYSAEDVIGRTIQEMHTKERVSPERFEQAIEMVRQEGKWEYEVVSDESDGKKRHVHSTVVPRWDEEGAISGYILFSRDVTEQEQAEQEREQLLHDLSERVKELSCMYGVAQSIRSRETMEAVFLDVLELMPPGWRYPEIARGRVLFDAEEYVLEPFEKTAWKQTSYIVVDGKQLGSVEVYYLEERPKLDEGPFVKEERNLIDGIARMLSEAIERKRAEEALAWEVKANKAIADLSSTLMTAMSIEDVSSLVLEKAKETTGSDFGFVGHIDPGTGNLVSSTLTRDIWDSCQVNDKSTVFERFTGLWGWVLNERRSLMTNSPQSDPRSVGTPPGHIPIRRFLSSPALIGDTLVGQIALANAHHDYSERDREFVERLAAVYAVATQRRRAEVMVQSARDELAQRVDERTSELTKVNQRLREEMLERERAQQALEEQRVLRMRTDRLVALGQMAGGMAHELNQPLTGVRGMAEHLLIAKERGWELSQEETTEKIRSIITQADRMTHVIDHIRLFAREAGSPRRSSVKVNGVIASCVELVGTQFRIQGMDLEMDLADDLPVVSANPFSLEEVVLNLMTNARDAVEELMAAGPDSGAKIVLRTRADIEDGRPWVKIEIADAGIGIPEDDLEKLFEPFFTTKEPDKGTGLGLAISQSIVEEWGGRIVVQSAVGRGTTMTVVLPAETSEKTE